MNFVYQFALFITCVFFWPLVNVDVREYAFSRFIYKFCIFVIVILFYVVLVLSKQGPHIRGKL